MINGTFGMNFLDKKNNMKIFIIGTNGMLGRYVNSYLKKKYTTIELNRDVLDCSKIDSKGLTKLLVSHNIEENDVIINCVGTIKPMIDKFGDLNAILVNSVFPRILSDVSEKLKVKLIHPTTDCVYNGKKGMYTELDEHDITDVYGRTKSLGEAKNCTIIRTSIIGEELINKRSLVEWVKSQKNNTINGYTNHLWNGITCLEWAKFVEFIINNDLFWNGVRHIYSPKVVNKAELVKMINDVYELNLTINEVVANESIDRTISSIHKKIYDIPHLYDQIKEMKNYIL